MTAVPGQEHAVRTEANYIDGPAGELFITRFRPRDTTDCSHAVICLPPFAEEMNKSRRMLALQGRLLADRGRMFVLPDVAGTGDSEGEFGDTTWRAWCDDIRSVVAWLQIRGVDRIDFLAVRSGVYLGLEMMATTPCRIALWSPVVRGNTMLDQLFRTVLVRGLGSGQPTSVAEIRDSLAQAGGMEVAGYWLSANLVSGIDALDSRNITFAAGSRVLWADVSPAVMDGVPRKAQRLLSDWDAQRATTEYSRFVGPQFWAGPEIEVVPELLEKTTVFLADD